MDKFYDRPPLFSRLGKEFKNIPESGSELSDKVDKIVVEIKNTRDEKKKQKMLEKLLVHIHPFLEKAVSRFYQRFHLMLSKQGFDKEDIYTWSVEALMKYVDKWEDRETRKSKNETPTHFASYFFNRNTLNNLLINQFLRPLYTGQRAGREVSMNQPISKLEGNGDDLQSILPDQKSEDGFLQTLKKEEIKIGRDAVLNKLYSDEDPFLSLIVMLRFGFDRALLEKWKEKFALSVKNGKIKKILQNHIPKVDQILKQYNDNEMTMQEVGDLFGVSRDNVRQRLERAFKILKKQF